MAPPFMRATDESMSDNQRHELRDRALVVYDEQDAEDREPELMRQRRLEQGMEGIIGRLDRLASEQVGKKDPIEKGWLDDLRAYHGRYDADTERALTSVKNKSRLFVKLTRQKTLGWEARLSDMLFPTDDKNWGINPTPVPSLVGQASDASKRAMQMVEQANKALAANDQGQADALAAQADAHATAGREASATMDEAKKCCDAMSKEMEDQLEEAQYPTRSRTMIRDACRLGTGIMKGPMVSHRKQRKWMQLAGTSEWVLKWLNDPRPDFLRINPWAFFPDMDAATIEETEFTFERWLPNKTMLKRMARDMEFRPEAVRDLLQMGPAEGLPMCYQYLREITGVQQVDGQRYQVWEYHGSLEDEELKTLAEFLDDPDLLDMVDDPLGELRVIIFFCQNKLLRFSIHPLDSGESLYSVFNFDQDDSSIFGFGVPRQMEDSQKALNGAWRMMMDNAALSVGPQVVVDKSQVEPEDGTWTLSPRKVWARIAASVQGQSPPFETFNIQNNQVELANIVKMAGEFADDETNMPTIAQGEQGAHVTPTSGGMSMLMNAANVVFRRVVKGWDDGITLPNIRRLYDFNMQFNPKPEIKGDMNVEARGSSVLLVREVQSQNLMQITSWVTHPVIGPMIKAAPLVRKTLQSLMIAPDDIVKDDDTIEREAKQLAAQGQPPSPDEVKLEIAKITQDGHIKVASLGHETAMMTLAAKQNMTLDQINGQLEKTRLITQSEERKMAAEVGAEARIRAEDRTSGGDEESVSGGGSIGGGGYVNTLAGDKGRKAPAQGGGR